MVLCGGGGTRLGGRDKPLVEWRGAPLLQSVLARLPPHEQRILSINRNAERYAEFGGELVMDDERGLGPLGGIASVATHVKHDWVWVVAGDTPRLPADLAQRLYASVASNPGAVYAASNRRQHYLPLLLPSALLSALPAFLDRGDLSMQAWLREIGARAARLADAEYHFANMNTAADLIS